MSQPAIPVIVVAFGNAGDVCRCLHALGRSDADPPFDVFISENGGPRAYDALLAALLAGAGPCERDATAGDGTPPRFKRVGRLRLRGGASSRPMGVRVGEARDNLGYAGGINAWLEVLLSQRDERRDWSGIWILNPDTEPLPGALQELASYAARHGRGMVGSRLVSREQPDLVSTRGLAWRKWRAATTIVDWQAPAGYCPPPAELDARLDAPSGASMFVTRACIDSIGLMDERYFLYFEDLDWGFRAGRRGAVGYAHQSVVLHEGGTTVGSATSRRRHSALAVYLDFRNRILFVRRHLRRWLPWAALVAALEVLAYVRLGNGRNTLAGARGLTDGLLGRSGRPDAMLRNHRLPPRPTATAAPVNVR